MYFINECLVENLEWLKSFGIWESILEIFVVFV